MTVYWNVLDQCLRYLTNTLGYTYLKLCDSLLGGEPLGVAGTYERSLFSACILSRAFWKERKRMGVYGQNFDFGEATDKHETKNLQETDF